MLIISFRCESLLISCLDTQNCIIFYQIVDQLNVDNLKEKCSLFITSRRVYILCLFVAQTFLLNLGKNFFQDEFDDLHIIDVAFV